MEERNKMADNKTIENIALVLLLVGGLNWGLSLFNVNLVTMLFGSIKLLPEIVYGLVGASALYTAWAKWMK